MQHLVGGAAAELEGGDTATLATARPWKKKKKKNRRVTGLSRSIEPPAIIAAFNPASL